MDEARLADITEAQPAGQIFAGAKDHIDREGTVIKSVTLLGPVSQNNRIYSEQGLLAPCWPGFFVPKQEVWR